MCSCAILRNGIASTCKRELCTLHTPRCAYHAGISISIQAYSVPSKSTLFHHYLFNCFSDCVRRKLSPNAKYLNEWKNITTVIFGRVGIDKFCFCVCAFELSEHINLIKCISAKSGGKSAKDRVKKRVKRTQSNWPSCKSITLITINEEPRRETFSIATEMIFGK